MAEREAIREREREPLAENPYERNVAQRAEQAQRQLVGPVVIRKSERPIFQSRQGKLQFFLDPCSFADTPLQHWRVFTHQITTRSGRHRHQGGLVIYVLDGTGYSVVDGERVDWQKGDLVLLPLRPGGVEHQHFNTTPDRPAQWAAFIPMPISEYLASEITQVEEAPEFRGGGAA